MQECRQQQKQTTTTTKKVKQFHPEEGNEGEMTYVFLARTMPGILIFYTIVLFFFVEYDNAL